MRLRLQILPLSAVFMLWSCNNLKTDRKILIKAKSANDLEKHSGNHFPVDKELDSIYQEYLQSYRSHCSIDTQFRLRDQKFALEIDHFCLMDSALTIPGNYVKIYKLDSFVSHNFASRIILRNNGLTIIDRTIYKQDFDSLLFPELRHYGALLCPNVVTIGDTISIEYSVSIPLSDVGALCKVEIIENDNGVIVRCKI